ncbi:TMCO1 [Mytilus edulis]|uniref:Calcium load-activated calcium channel n=1 Tax=Mytilus edulis TaxID=6550 RepID=A0A8S3TJG7_MYTED|nr:TMCO1 [Mytilus edulis]
MLSDCLLIVFISICTALLGEGLTWVLVYRTEKYKKLKAEVEKQSKKLEKKKESGESSDRNQKKKIERQEEKLKNNNRDLSFVSFAFTALLSMFNSIFDGRVVAKLPFTPISLLQGISHRNLGGDDYTHCSFIFLYILCTMSIRQNIQKILGLSPSRAASKQGGGLFSPPTQLTK